MSKPIEGVYAVLIRNIEGRAEPHVSFLKLDSQRVLATEPLAEAEARALEEVLHRAIERGRA